MTSYPYTPPGNYLALDLGGTCGIAQLVEGNFTTHAINLNGGKVDGRKWRRLLIFRDLLDATMDAHKFDLVFYECPVRHNNTYTAHIFGEYAGLLKLAAGERGVPIKEFNPSTIKKAATGKGNADKTAVMLAMRARYPGVLIQDDNSADALAVLTLALAQENLEEAIHGDH